MSVPVKQLMETLAGAGSATGYPVQVLNHEPKSATWPELAYAVFLNAILPVPAGSGLALTSVRVEFTGRLYKPFLSEPEDLIDPDLGAACDAIMAAYSGDFDLQGLARNVDLLGASGPGLQARAGYLKIDQTMFRIFDITIPVIVNDAFGQVA